MTGKTKQPLPDENESKGSFMRFLGVASLVGINLVACTFIGFAIGWLLDNKVFDTAPWFTLIFFIIGIAAGFRYLFRIASRLSDTGNSDKSS